MTPRVTLTVGSARYDTHVTEAVVSLGFLPGVGTAHISLPSATQFDAAPGENVEITLNSGEREAVVLTGTIGVLHRDLRAVEIVAADAGALLGSARPAATFEALSAGDVIRKLAGEAGVEVRISGADVELPYYVAHQGQTAAEHVAALARLCGCLALVNAEGAVDVHPTPQGRPEVALRYGRELLDYRAASRPVAPSFVRLGSGPAGNAGAPNALLPSFDRLPASAPAPGTETRWIPTSVIKTPGGATTASNAESRVHAASRHQVRAVCFLLPHIRPGAVLEVQDLPEELASGPWLVTRVRHHVGSPRGARTIIEGWTAKTGSLFDGIFGAALAGGGLL